jgi:hypothetical protein
MEGRVNHPFYTLRAIKGMSPAQVEEIRKTQELQRRENKLIQNQNKEIDNHWDNDRIQQAKTLMLMERRHGLESTF